MTVHGRSSTGHVAYFDLCDSLHQPLQLSEPLPIGDWLALYKLPEYLSLFEASGYDSTDFVVGITQEVRLTVCSCITW